MAFDRTNASDLASLKAEVNTDPESVGYDQNANVTELMGLLNLESNNPQLNDEVAVPFDEFPIIDAIDEIVKSEYDALTPRDKVYVDSIIQSAIARAEDNGIGVAHFGPVKKIFRKAFGATSTTFLAVKDDRMRHASRAEKLFGRDTVLTQSDWFAARDS